MYYRRVIVPTNGQAWWGVPLSDWDKQPKYIEYLAALNQATVAATQRVFWAETTIWWHDDVQFSREVDQRLEAQADNIQTFVNVAEERGFTTLAGVKLKIVPQLEDQRVKGTGPLPAVSPREVVLQ